MFKYTAYHKKLYICYMCTGKSVMFYVCKMYVQCVIDIPKYLRSVYVN